VRTLPPSTAIILCMLCVSSHAAGQDVEQPLTSPAEQFKTFSKSKGQVLAGQEGRMQAGEASSGAKDVTLAEAKAAHERRDYLAERQLIEPLARDGDAEAQARLGFLFRFGLGVPANHAESVAWFHKAALQGNAWAQQNLGVALTKGEGVAKDIAEGVRWLEKAGDNGFVSAYYNLGELYLHGTGVAKDREKGLAFFAMAANGGDMTAAFALGSVYEQGLEADKDLAKAELWYRKGAGLGFFMCQYNLGRMYAGGLGVPQDFVEAYKWAELAAESGPPDAKTLRDFLKPKLSATQIAEAERLIRDWKATHTSLKMRPL
jgi:TPR repeat protein